MTDGISKCSNISQRTKTILNMAVEYNPPTTTKQTKIIKDSKVSQHHQGLPEPKVTNIDNIFTRSYSLTSSLFDTFNNTQTTFDLQDKTILENTITKMNETFRKEEDINQDKQSNNSNYEINKDSPHCHDTEIDLICYEVMPPKDFSTRNRSRNIEYSLKEITQDVTSPDNNQLDFDSDDSTRDKDYYPSGVSESEDDILDLRSNKSKAILSRKKKIPKASKPKPQTALNTKNIISPTDVLDFKIKKPTRRHSLGSIQKSETISAASFSRKRRNTIDIYYASQKPPITNSSETVQSPSVALDPELSQPSRKRKKYNTSVAQRKLESINKKKIEHGVKPGCTDKCLKKCSTKINQEDKLAVNKKYWENMSWSEQHAFVAETTSVAIPKRKTTTESKRRPKRTFTLKKLDGVRVEVCKITFLTTLGYEKTNDRILHYDIKDITVDGRGQHQKTPKHDRDLLTQHILSFNPTEYHHRREHAPLRRYLPSDINIVSMHQDYCTKYPDKKVSYELYRQHLKTMNISFTQLGHEECETCETYNLHKKQTSHDAKIQIVANCSSCVEWSQHHEKYKMARQLYSEHKELPRNDDEIYYSTDLEKVIMLPRMDTFKSIIFCKRLIAFNQTFAPVGKITNECKPLTVIWNDSIAGRKQEDIMSALFHFLRRNRDAKRIHLWLDNCTSQNKNWLLYSFLVYMINSDMIYAKNITLYYFEPGHTFMSCDQVHHQVELAMKKKGRLYDFTDFEEAVASINKNKVIVKSMAATDFIDIENYTSDRRIQTSNPRAYLKDMCQVQSPVLVVELTLNRLEGTQLRALGLLSVFGFNITYAVRAPTDPPGPTSCSAIECRLLGHCYARQDFHEFYCSCFEGYSGADCGVGPLCPKTTNMCKNGGTCRQMGPAAVSCICAPGYTGDLCESQIASPECGIEECSEGCKEGTTCDCNPKDTDFSSARFETRLQVVEQPNINISQEVTKQITSYLKASNITLEDEIEILNISSVESNGARVVWLRVWGARREAGTLRAALARLAATRSRADRLRLLPATLHFDMQPALSLHALIVNQRPEVWEGSEFILSCMAYGSPDISFTWYKDGVKINFNGTTRDIWTRTVSEDALGRRMSVLGVAEAKAPDGGKWSCSADDGGRRRCRALRLAVLKPPDIRLVPSTLTVNKGDNVSITCLAGAGRVHGALGFSWARERNLLPLAPGREVWEDLFPAGSVLKLYNVQKSGEFRCQVSSVAGTNAKGVTMWALGANDVACESDASHGLRWPKTAPGAYASASCPPGHNGETTRFCEPKTGQHGVKWMLPDFSGCVADSLKDIYEQFAKISYGYSWGNVSNVAHQYGAVLRSLPSHPGEGTLPLYHSREMLHYLLSSAGQPADRLASTEHLLKIYDTLLKHPDAFLDEEKIYELQNAVADTGGMKDNLEQHFHEFSIRSKPVREEEAHFDLQATPTGAEEWTLTSAGVELVARTGNASVVAVLYHNLAVRLPSLRRSIEFNQTSSRNGREMEYLISSQQVQLSASGPGVDSSLQHSVKLIFTHVKNYSAVASKLACGLRTSSDPRAWSTKACEVRVTEPTHVMCRCRGLGTFALFTIARSTLTDAEKDLRGIVKITASLGGAMCLAAAALQLLALVPGRKARLPVFLKAATAGTHSAAMLALLECDTRQEEACPGTLGWVCAACWCAGCAALCAQPLLLQAELAGRSQKGPSVGLLAGVCTLAWLTARLWGGAPLQVGAAAAAVCAAGCALLASLCLALALCAALRLRTITHKVPPERRTYLKDRARVVRHTLVLVVTTTAAQAAGVAYAQPGERRVAHVAALSAAALANGIAMIVCYVIRDEECLRSARRVLSLPSNKDWQDSPNGDTSLSLYIKQGGEVESRGGVGVLETSSSPVSPMTSYWRAPGLESPARLNRRQSNPDCRADIVRCVEYKDSVLSPRRYERHLATTHAVCDLIPHTPIQPEYMARVCLELGVLNNPRTPPRESPTPLLTCSVDFEPYNEKHRFDTSKENCSICVQSNPDISRIPSPPIKSCLKKSKSEFTSTSLPSIEVKDDKKSDIEQVNREWNKAYDSPETDRMLNKISNDLDFLLNRTQENSKILDQIEEAPT